MIPGIATGVTEEPLKQPALPKEAPSPGLPGSTRNTRCPSRCSHNAAHTPTMPAPITPTRRAPSAAIARPRPRPDQHGETRRALQLPRHAQARGIVNKKPPNTGLLRNQTDALTILFAHSSS